MNETVEAPELKKASTARRRVRVGRPPLEQAGEVEERILDAASKIFLERGFDGASIDQIALAARAGKPTIYCRFPNKPALFMATGARNITRRNARLGSHKPTGATIDERLTSIGVALLRETLKEEFVGLLRLAIAEARRFPDLVRDLTQMARQRGTETVAKLLCDAVENGGSGALPDCQKRFPAAAQIFTEMILLPPLMRALSGQSLESLDAEIDSHVAQRIAFFLAACRKGDGA